MLSALGWRSQSQCGRIGLQMKPIELGGRLGRWSSGRGPLPVLLAARLRQLIDEGTCRLSKTVWAGLGTGWVRAPEPVIARLGRLLAVHDLGGNIPGQLAAAGLLPRLEPSPLSSQASRHISQCSHDPPCKR
jgi:hypothetical protein